jgi:protein-arginine kinase activator protein McsA
MVRRKGEDIYRTFVCRECAVERTRLFAGAGLSFDRIAKAVQKSDTSKTASYSCRLCGTTLADIIVDGRPGCCLCYARFAAEIEDAVMAAQGSLFHVGKTPGQ